MHAARTFVDKLRANPVQLMWWVFGFFVVLHIFIFRDVVVAIPDIMQGKATIVREELIPFFDFSSQFFSEGASALTSSDEVRVTYSFWTAWVRYHYVLPFALVLLNAISAFVLFYAFHRLGRYFYKKRLFGVVAAILATILIHTIMLYSKIAHFYVLIIGFSMFSLALTLICEQVFFKNTLQKRNIFAVSLLVLANPAVHYHVLFYFMFVLLIITHAILTFFMDRPRLWIHIKKWLIYFVTVTSISLIPYVLLIYFATATTDVSSQIPVNYWMIFYASLSLPFIFSLDTAGHLDLIRYGNYITPSPRLGGVIVAVLVGSLFLFKQWPREHFVRRVLLVFIFSTVVLAMWMTIGYSINSPFSFHEFLGQIATFFEAQKNTLGDTITKGLGVFVNILRFPHRFQFIYFYGIGVLFTIALVWLRDAWSRKINNGVVTVAVVLLALAPVIGSSDYRTALLSGNMANFVAPYTIPHDLTAIKQQLAQTKDSKMFILPTLESGREIVQDGQRYSFLDKFLIYYLNQPTFYYGVGANTENKISAYLAYRAITSGEGWWEEILANNLGVTHILVPKKLEPRALGITYMPDIGPKIDAALDQSKRFTKTYDGPEFALYALAQAPTNSTPLLIDMGWDNLVAHLKNAHIDTQMYLPLQFNGLAPGPFTLATDSPERSYYDLYASRSTQIFRPNPVLLPFKAELVASSNFTNNALSLTTLYSKQDDYNFLQENVPTLTSLQRSSFIGLTEGSVKLDINIKVPADGTYRLLLHGGSKGDTITAVAGGQRLTFTKLPDDKGREGDHIDFTYFYTDISLIKGEHVIALENTDQNAVLVDSLMLMPSNDIPDRFTTTDTPLLKLTPTATPGLYKLLLKEAI
ncbi:MAG TPA: hypothetical protein VM581_04690 [Magnetospirillaceae bacterium]|nr:hypothetical protein [Magnetospirillaceae bacterium]